MTGELKQQAIATQLPREIQLAALRLCTLYYRYISANVGLPLGGWQVADVALFVTNFVRS